jgi:hypothetical protein
MPAIAGDVSGELMVRTDGWWDFYSGTQSEFPPFLDE